MNRPVLVFITMLLALASGSAVAAVINVPGDYEQIHDAVQAAQAGDTVMVAAGTYTDCTHETEGPGSTPACVIMKDGVTLMGAGSDQTIIDAEGLGRGIYVHDTDDVRIENLQVRGAYAAIYGAGILVRQGSTGAEIVDCVIRDNEDGGVIVFDGSEATLTSVQFLSNVAKQGGGLAIEETSTATVSECRFEGNVAPSGAGMFVRNGCTVTLTASVFVANAIDSDFGNGGGLAVQDSQCDISGCEFLDNTTRGAGGGVAFLGGATGTFENSLIAGNSTEASFNYGGGIHCEGSGIVMRGLVVADNAADSEGSDGGGLQIWFASDPAPVVENCTIVGNSCNAGGGAGILVQFGAEPAITNCIIADSVGGPGIGCIGADTFTVTGCNLWNNSGGDGICAVDGGCNFSADPLFCNAADGNYGVEPSSPCAAGNHPDGGGCGATHCGAFPAGCGTPAPDTPAARLVLGNAPNPFNPMTTMYFVLDEPGDAVVRILDLRGRILRTFARHGLAAGTRHEITWNGRDERGRELPSGVYLYQLETRGRQVTERMSLIR
ncbi:hypothetical protein GF314_13140 [bacterium]|nr:hypothetical protein [bacterium]